MDLVVTLFFIVLLAAYQLWQRRSVIIPAKVTVVEKVTLVISLLVIGAVTYLGSTRWEHYGIAAALILLILASLAKTGMTEKQVQTMGSLLFFQNLRSLKSATFILNSNGQEFELQTTSRGKSLMLTYDRTQLEKTMELIGRYVSRDEILVLTEEEYYRKRGKI